MERVQNFLNHTHIPSKYAHFCANLAVKTYLSWQQGLVYKYFLTIVLDLGETTYAHVHLSDWMKGEATCSSLTSPLPTYYVSVLGYLP